MSNDTTIDEAELALLAIPLNLARDSHLERCDTARQGGPDATLACEECGRAKWMHATRHDTCGQFCYVTEHTITREQIQTLRFVRGISHDVKIACSKALNEFGGYSDVTIRDAKRCCAVEFSRIRARSSTPRKP